MLCCHSRHESLARELQSTQGSVANELEERKSNCQELRATLEGLHAQLIYAEEKKKQVWYILNISVSNIALDYRIFA